MLMYVCMYACLYMLVTFVVRTYSAVTWCHSSFPLGKCLDIIANNIVTLLSSQFLLPGCLPLDLNVLICVVELEMSVDDVSHCVGIVDDDVASKVSLE